MRLRAGPGADELHCYRRGVKSPHGADPRLSTSTFRFQVREEFGLLMGAKTSPPRPSQAATVEKARSRTEHG